MSIPLTVTVERKNGKATLVVNPSDLRVPQAANLQELDWHLSGGSSNKFYSQDNNPPGFQWITAPPSGIFGNPALSADQKDITMSDDNEKPADRGGPWTYRLNADIDGETVSSEVMSTAAGGQSARQPKASATMVGNSPTIKNN